MDAVLLAHLARLARLELDADEAPLLVAQLERILAHVDRMRALPLDAVEPLSTPLALDAVLAPDQVGPMLDRDAALSLTPPGGRDGAFFAVPKVIGGGDGSPRVPDARGGPA